MDTEMRSIDIKLLGYIIISILIASNVFAQIQIWSDEDPSIYKGDKTRENLWILVNSINENWRLSRGFTLSVHNENGKQVISIEYSDPNMTCTPLYPSSGTIYAVGADKISAFKLLPDFNQGFLNGELVWLLKSPVPNGSISYELINDSITVKNLTSDVTEGIDEIYLPSELAIKSPTELLGHNVKIRLKGEGADSLYIKSIIPDTIQAHFSVDNIVNKIKMRNLLKEDLLNKEKRFVFKLDNYPYADLINKNSFFRLPVLNSNDFTLGMSNVSGNLKINSLKLNEKRINETISEWANTSGFIGEMGLVVTGFKDEEYKDRIFCFTDSTFDIPFKSNFPDNYDLLFTDNASLIDRLNKYQFPDQNENLKLIPNPVFVWGANYEAKLYHSDSDEITRLNIDIGRSDRKLKAITIAAVGFGLTTVICVAFLL